MEMAVEDAKGTTTAVSVSMTCQCRKVPFPLEELGPVPKAPCNRRITLTALWKQKMYSELTQPKDLARVNTIIRMILTIMRDLQVTYSDALGKLEQMRPDLGRASACNMVFQLYATKQEKRSADTRGAIRRRREKRMMALLQDETRRSWVFAQFCRTIAAEEQVSLAAIMNMFNGTSSSLTLAMQDLIYARFPHIGAK